MFSNIREEYKAIFSFRKHQNPPIDGKNSLWIQQLFLVEELNKLLLALIKLKGELSSNTTRNVGFDTKGLRKRVMLITTRIMPPFGEIYRLIESTGAIIVCEEIDMGITNTGLMFFGDCKS